jgi:hypothetical protein
MTNIKIGDLIYLEIVYGAELHEVVDVELCRSERPSIISLRCIAYSELIPHFPYRHGCTPLARSSVFLMALNSMWVAPPKALCTWAPKILDKKDIVLYSHLAYKSERFFELI